MEALLAAAGAGDLESLENAIAGLDNEAKRAAAAARDSERRTALHFAAAEGHTGVCAYLVQTLGVDVNPRDLHGETPLYISIKNGHVGTANLLLTNGADPRIKSLLGITTLHQAAIRGDLELVMILLENGVKLNSHSYTMGTPLACAVKSGSFPCFDALVKVGAAPETMKYPLHDAAECGSTEIVNYFLEAGYDPNSCNEAGLKPIQIAASKNNLAVVEVLFPLTTQVSDFPNWTVPCIMEYAMRKNEEMATDQAHIEEADPWRSQFVKRAAKELSDKEIEQELGRLLVKNENEFFKEWSPMKRRLFYESTLVRPTSVKQISDHDGAKIKNSVIFDLTYDNRAQSSYLRAISHYRAWHFSGSDLIYEVGPERKKFCVSRKDQTFVFWFRYFEQDVGLVIDGQSVWVEGILRRSRAEDGKYSYRPSIQFNDARKEGSSSHNQQAPLSDKNATPYIVDTGLIMADYGGTYAGAVSKMKVSLRTTRTAVVAVAGHDKKESLHKNCHVACDNLVLFATEAGKNLWVFQYTMHSLDPKLQMPISVPSSLDGTVTNHEQVSRSVLSTLGKVTGKKINDLDRGGYNIVKGAVFRTLWQCINAYVILRRKTVFKTKFFLKSKDSEYRTQVRNKPQGQRNETTEEFKERLRGESLRTGTLFDAKSHAGVNCYKDPRCSMPPIPSRKMWYHSDELFYHSEE
ncbi:uncharacterized protein LOC119278357 [Triticum dicoccoides]|uniref:uncharacterized protein LOC119278357 n=1 Tax=Triticum dicoccoides TaxID=85692 RepID=UPI00188F97C4|nr:uncharacterized protein LOC119278357 [Triticum dicoccoides]